MTHDRRVPWWVPILLAGAISFGTMIFIEATHNDRQTADRMSAVEAHLSASDATQKATSQRQDAQDGNIAYVRGRVDAIFDKLSSWEKK